MKSFLVCLLILVASFYNCFASDIESRIVKIKAELSNNRVSQGTGFYWNDNRHVLTAYHVVKDARKITIVHNGNKYEDIVIEQYSNEYDLILLRIQDTIRTEKIYLQQMVPSAELKLDKRLTVYAFPYGWAQHHKFYADPTHLRTIESRTTYDRRGKFLFNLNIEVISIVATVFSGMSGAPVLYNSDELIGVISGSLTEGGSICWAIPLSYTEKMIAVNKRPRDFIWPKLLLMDENICRSIDFGQEMPETDLTITVATTKALLEYNIESINPLFYEWESLSALSATLNIYKYHINLGIEMGLLYFDYGLSYETLPGQSNTEITVNHYIILLGLFLDYRYRGWILQPFIGLGAGITVLRLSDVDMFGIVPQLRAGFDIAKFLSMETRIIYVRYVENSIDFNFYGESDISEIYIDHFKLYLGLSVHVFRTQFPPERFRSK